MWTIPILLRTTRPRSRTRPANVSERSCWLRQTGAEGSPPGRWRSCLWLEKRYGRERSAWAVSIMPSDSLSKLYTTKEKVK